MDYLDQMLKKYYGENAEFKEGQKEAVESVLDGKRTLVVQKTGWGKSLIYFMSTKILRSQGKGVTLIISPLLVLMNNQIDSARKFDLNVKTINSSNSDEWDEIHVEDILVIDDLLMLESKAVTSQMVRKNDAAKRNE